MTGTQTNQNAPSIWQLKNTARITKTTIEFGFAIAAIVMAGAAIYTAAKGVALSSVLPAFLANPWVIAIIVSVAAAYLIATAVSSYQQISSIEGAQGKAGANGKDADLTALLGDAIVKSGTIVEESGNLFLTLSKDNYDALTNGKEAGKEVTLHVVSSGKSVEVKFKHLAPDANAKEHKVALTCVGGKDVSTDIEGAKQALGEENLGKSLKIYNPTEMDEPLTKLDIFKITHLTPISQSK